MTPWGGRQNSYCGAPTHACHISPRAATKESATASTVRHDVPAGALVYNERRERVRDGWTAEKRKKMAKQTKS